MQNAATSKPKKKGLKMPHLLVLILSLLVLMSLMTYISRRSVRHRSGNRRLS